MALSQGVHYRIKTYRSGRRERQTVFNGRVIETKVMVRAKQTKARKSLRRARRRIGR